MVCFLLQDQIRMIGIAIGLFLLVIACYCIHRYYEPAPQRPENSAANQQNNGIQNAADHNAIPLNNPWKQINKILYSESQVLGAGTEGVVYRGNFENRIPAAIKRYNYCITNRSIAIRNTVVKANQNLMSATCHNIVKYYCFEVYCDNLYICMELCDCNVTAYIEDRNDLPADSLGQVINGLHFLHERNILHRDIKPSNILVKDEVGGHVRLKLSDFSVAKEMTQLTGVECGSYVGSDGWLAPEVHEQLMLRRNNVRFTYTKSADIFSLGLVCYFLATQGHQIFQTQADIANDRAYYNQLPRNAKHNLIYEMTLPHSNDRPNSEFCLKHPCHWAAGKILEFYKKVSDMLRYNQRMTASLETNSNQIIGNSWRTQLTTNLDQELFTPRRGRTPYQADQVKFLLRAIRYTKDHIQDMPHLHGEMGNTEVSIQEFWDTRFPGLLMHTYTACQTFSHAPYLQPFYS